MSRFSFSRHFGSQKSDHGIVNAGELATALDAASFVLLHGNRHQQIIAANSARSLLDSKGYPVRRSKLINFVVKARVGTTGTTCTHTWNAVGFNSMDVMLDALEQFEGQFVSISVSKRAKL